jgi:hypothetical protein
MKMENPSGVTAHRIERFLQVAKIWSQRPELQVYHRTFSIANWPSVCSLSRISFDIAETRTGPVGQRGPASLTMFEVISRRCLNLGRRCGRVSLGDVPLEFEAMIMYTLSLLTTHRLALLSPSNRLRMFSHATNVLGLVDMNRCMDVTVLRIFSRFCVVHTGPIFRPRLEGHRQNGYAVPF